MKTWGGGVIVCRILYLLRPNIFQRWFWKRTAISQRLLTLDQNTVYMRVLGSALIVVGIIMLMTSK